MAALPASVAEGVARLLSHCRSPEFIQSAMAHRSARFVGDLPPLPRPTTRAQLTAQSRVTQAPLAIASMVHLGTLVDFSQPGERTGIHAGAEPALRYILETPSFRVNEIPGLSDDVRLALVERLVSSGFLEAKE
jgi:hypothetical protein